jgi:hypothetical protein
MQRQGVSRDRVAERELVSGDMKEHVKDRSTLLQKQHGGASEGNTGAESVNMCRRARALQQVETLSEAEEGARL